MATKSLQNHYRKLPADLWDQIGREYKAGGSPAEICHRYGLATSTFFSRARAAGWQREAAAEEAASAAGLALGGGGRVPSAGPTAADRAACDSSAGIPAAWAEEPVMTAAVRQGAALGESSANLLAQVATSGHLAMTRHLRHRVDQLTADERLGAGQMGRMSRAAVDLATAIEKLQRVERAALGLDRNEEPARGQVVIVLPAKLSLDDWLASRHGGGGCSHGPTESNG